MHPARLLLPALFLLLTGLVFANTCYDTIQDVPVTCTGTITSDSWNGCRKIDCESSAGTIGTLACNKGSYFEVYRQSSSGTPPKVCYGATCVQANGYAKGTFPVCTEEQTPTCTPATEVCDGKDNNCNGQVDENNVCVQTPPPEENTCYNSMKTMPASCTGGTITTDSVSGGGRTIICTNNADNMKIQAWDKSGYFEMYKQQQTGSSVSKICIGETCISNSGFARSTNFPICTQGTTPPTNNQTNTTATINLLQQYSADHNVVLSCDAGFTPDEIRWNFGDGKTFVKNNLSIIRYEGESDSSWQQRIAAAKTTTWNTVWHSYTTNGTYQVTCDAIKGSQLSRGSTSVSIRTTASSAEILSNPDGYAHRTNITFLGNTTYQLYPYVIGMPRSMNYHEVYPTGMSSHLTGPSNAPFTVVFPVPGKYAFSFYSGTSSGQYGSQWFNHHEEHFCHDDVCEGINGDVNVTVADPGIIKNPGYSVTQVGPLTYEFRCAVYTKGQTSYLETGDGQPAYSMYFNHTYSSPGTYNTQCFATEGNFYTYFTKTVNATSSFTNQTQPPSNQTNACYSSVKNIPVTCTSTITQDTWNGCRQVVCGTSTDNIKALACDKGTNFEVYRQSTSGTAPKVCFGDTCIQKEGYMKSGAFPICMQSTGTNTTNQTQQGTGNITILQEYSKEHNQVMVCNVPTVNATSYTWTVNGQKVFEKNLSSYGYYTETFSHYLHAFPGNGTYTVGCSGTDAQGKTENATRTIAITTRATPQEIAENPTVVRTSARYTGNYTANVSCTVIGVADPTAFFQTSGGYSDANGSISTEKRGYGSTLSKEEGQFERMEALPGKGTYTLSCRGAVMNENMARFYQNAGQGIGFGCFGGARGGDPVCETNTKSSTVTAPFEASTKNGQIEVVADPQNTTRYYATPRISYADHWYCETPSGDGYSSAGTPVAFTSTQDTATISCSYDDGSTGSGWGQDASISSVVNLAAIRSNTTPATSDDPGQTSTLRFVRATLNGQTLTPQNRTLYTTPGAPITGTITFTYNNTWPQGIGMTWGYTTRYSYYTDAYSGASGAMAPSGEITIPVNTAAPDYRMADYLVLAYRAEKTPADLFSMTNWARSSGPVWFDGNDIANWNPRMLQQAMSTGRVQGDVLFENQYKQLYVPSDAIIINTGQIETLNETFSDGDYTNNPTWQQVGSAATFEVVNGELHIKKTNSNGLSLIELRGDIPVTDKTTVSIDSRKVSGSSAPITLTIGAYTYGNDWQYMNVPVASTTTWTRNQEFNVKQYIPDGYRVNWIRITTSDASMEAYVDNFKIYEK